jgi:branched-chain amino acid transport system substrate-binding protein
MKLLYSAISVGVTDHAPRYLQSRGLKIKRIFLVSEFFDPQMKNSTLLSILNSHVSLNFSSINCAMVSSLIQLFLKLLITIFITGNAEEGWASNAITFAAIFSETGIAASHNEPLIQMTKLAVEEVNNQGGLLNRRIELILLDNESTPIGAAVAAQKAVDMNVTAVIGAHWSSHSLAMAPILQKAGIPMISPGSTNPEVTKVGNYIFRACFLDSFQGMAMAHFAIDELGAHSAITLKNIDETYSVTLADFFQKSFIKSGGTVLADFEYRGNAVDFADIIDQIKSINADVLYLPGYTRDSGLLLKQAKAMGVTGIFLGGDAWDEIETYADSSLNGSYQSAPWHPNVPFKRSADLQKLYMNKYGKLIKNMSAPLAYDAVYLLVEAIERCQSLDRKLIRDALDATDSFEGATGNISFDANGDPENKAVVILKYQGKARTYYSIIQP